MQPEPAELRSDQGIATYEAGATPARRKRLYADLSVQVLVAMLLGVLAGYLWPQTADAMKTLGDLFIKIVRMLVAPIIFCTVVHGIASAGQARQVGRIAVKALIYFEIITTLAMVIALIFVNIWQPGTGMNVNPNSLADSGVQAAKPLGFGQFLLSLVPSSAIGAFAEGEVLPVLFFSLMFAFGLLALGPAGRPIADGIHSVSQVLFKMIRIAMYVAPIGAFGAIAFTVGKFGPSTLVALGRLVAEFYVCCALFVAMVLAPVAWLAGINIFRLIRYIAPELMIVVGTSSGESVFPQLTAKLCQLGVKESVVGLVLPAGYSFNHDGTCLYVRNRFRFPGSSRWYPPVTPPAVRATRHHALHIQRRSGGRGFRHRGARHHTIVHGDHTGRERRADTRRASPVVLGLRAGQRIGECARNHRDCAQ